MPGPNERYAGVELLGENEGSGQLHIGEDGRAFRQLSDAGDASRPSLAGSQGSQAKGIGGTVVGAESGMGGPNTRSEAPVASGQSRKASHQLSPAEMLIWAEQQEQDLMDKTRAAENPYGSSLESSIDRPSTFGSSSTVPEWLTQYMDKQPFTDPYHQVMPGRVDIINSNKYLTEREKLKAIKSLQETGKMSF